MRREICGDCGAPINDDGSCDCTELLKRGWRRCAKWQKATQWCAEAERIRGELREQIERDEALLRQALEALEGMEKWASSIYDGYPPSTASIAAAPYRAAASAAIAALHERLSKGV